MCRNSVVVVEAGGLPELPGCQPSSRLSERPGLKGIRGGAIEQDTGHLLVSGCVNTHMHTSARAYTHTHYFCPHLKARDAMPLVCFQAVTK